jgi:hypothetical protein
MTSAASHCRRSVGLIGDDPCNRLQRLLERRSIRATTWNTPATLTAIASGWLEDGTADLFAADKRRDAAVRQAMASRCVRTSERSGPVHE